MYCILFDGGNDIMSYHGTLPAGSTHYTFIFAHSAEPPDTWRYSTKEFNCIECHYRIQLPFSQLCVCPSNNVCALRNVTNIELHPTDQPSTSHPKSFSLQSFLSFPWKAKQIPKCSKLCTWINLTRCHHIIQRPLEDRQSSIVKPSP